MIRKFSTLLTALLVCLTLSAQKTATIRGIIKDAANGEPVSFCNVLLEGTNYGTAADMNGIFVLSKIPLGTYTMIFSYVGYESYKESITLSVGGEIAAPKISISQTATELGPVEVNGGDGGMNDPNNPIPSLIIVGKKEIDLVPTTGGGSDIVSFFQTVPGVVSTGDQGGQLYVRGGAPIQNRVLLDGMTIYNPFHSIGFFSVFDTDIIRNTKIYTGGYPSDYGGRISSVMDISTRDGNKKEMQGKFSATPFGAKVMLEGPILRAKDNNSGSISYLFSGKTSYLAQSSKIFYSYIDSTGLPFNYTDLFGKLTFDGASGSKINLFGFRFVDSVKYQAISDLKWDAWGAGGNFVLIPQGSPLIMSGKFSMSHYGITLDDKSNYLRFSEVDGFNFGFDFKYYLSKDEIRYGVEVIGYNTNYETYNASNFHVTQSEATTELAAYFSYKITRGRLLIEPGARLHWYTAFNNISPEPRLDMLFNVNEKLRFKFASGLYSQNLISSNSDRDVVNLFYGFLSGSSNLPDTYTNQAGEEVDLKHYLQKATHIIFGSEYSFTDKLSGNIEGYYKIFNQITNVNRNKIYEDNVQFIDKPDELKKDYLIETGDAKGVDMVLKYTSDKNYIWFTYSLGKVTRWDGVSEIEYAPIWDRRHNINLVAMRKLGKNGSWEISARWNYGSALPFTQTAGFYGNVPMTNINTNVNTVNPDYVSVIYGGLNGGRMSDYHRLDLSAKKTIDFKKVIKSEDPAKKDKEVITSTMEIIISVTNTYNRENIFYVDRITNEKVFQLPVIPAIGFSWAF
jgi:hypothetical protein